MEALMARVGKEIVRARRAQEFGREVARIVWERYADNTIAGLEESLGSPLSQREKQWLKFGCDAFVRAAVMGIVMDVIELQLPCGPSLSRERGVAGNEK
jgi:hypothetical protein